jgi:hypothetical protein
VRYYLLVLITALCALSVWGCVGLTHHLIVGLDRWSAAAPDLVPTIARANQALDTINAPCAGNQPCRGTLGLINKTVAKVGDAVVTTQLQERAITPHTVAAMDTLNNSAQRLGATADAATDALGAGKRTLTVMPGLIEAYTRSGNDLDALLRSEALSRTVDNFAGMTSHFNHMSSTADQLETHFAKPYLNPSRNPFKRTWEQIHPFLVTGAKVTATLF